MEFEEILLWFSWISLFFWSGVLIWCVATLIIRAKKEREWLDGYVPTLQSDVAEWNIGSYYTLSELEQRKLNEMVRRQRAREKRSSMP